ncbi:hypothetical protein [Parasegetibacter sp. NRK P23]|uniref:hypothetical protein n=1 Tax=Parasegetibacter sp. NRK P23 TaxID=2942999 RepID=UPI002042FF9E|nr:hypothetical protein [Parasegetibacter sp. NRK P23]MCM5528979.1 hypothetical protein [Parasegetibacter sp. NRK P23]
MELTPIEKERNAIIERWYKSPTFDRIVKSLKSRSKLIRDTQTFDDAKNEIFLRLLNASIDKLREMDASDFWKGYLNNSMLSMSKEGSLILRKVIGKEARSLEWIDEIHGDAFIDIEDLNTDDKEELLNICKDEISKLSYLERECIMAQSVAIEEGGTLQCLRNNGIRITIPELRSILGKAREELQSSLLARRVIIKKIPYVRKMQKQKLHHETMLSPSVVARHLYEISTLFEAPLQQAWSFPKKCLHVIVNNDFCCSIRGIEEILLYKYDSFTPHSIGAHLGKKIASGIITTRVSSERNSIEYCLTENAKKAIKLLERHKSRDWYKPGLFWIIFLQIRNENKSSDEVAERLRMPHFIVEEYYDQACVIIQALISDKHAARRWQP